MKERDERELERARELALVHKLREKQMDDGGWGVGGERKSHRG
jgi:hypothetical protein